MRAPYIGMFGAAQSLNHAVRSLQYQQQDTGQATALRRPTDYIPERQFEA